MKRFDVIVLARLSGPSKKQPTAAKIAEAVRPLALPAASPAEARATVEASLATLRDRGLLDDKRRVTDAGKAALRESLAVDRLPPWRILRGALLPALALGLRPGSDEARRALTDDRISVAVIEPAKLGRTAAELCDELIAAALGMAAGPMTLGRIRSHVLARRGGIEPKGTPDEIAARLAAKQVGAARRGKPALIDALVRRWLADPAVQVQPAPAPAPLSSAIRTAIASVGPAGRFGPEKVFVSEIWRRLDTAMELDGFKRWLLEANAAGTIVLARADLVGAMDPQLVAASEIVDRGATFHFVLDREATIREGRHVG